MQVEALTQENVDLMKEIEKLREERETHEQLVTYFVEELKQSRDKQRELMAREKQMLSLLQKIVNNGVITENPLRGKDAQDMMKRLQARSALKSQQDSSLASDELVNAFLGVKIEGGPNDDMPRDPPDMAVVAPAPQLPSTPEHQPFPSVPSSPLWNSWPTDFFGNLMEDHEPYLQPVGQVPEVRDPPSLSLQISFIFSPPSLPFK